MGYEKAATNQIVASAFLGALRASQFLFCPAFRQHDRRGGDRRMAPSLDTSVILAYIWAVSDQPDRLPFHGEHYDD
jgi:hypothetical protein